MTSVGLESLPVELLYEIQLHALSDFFPLTSRHIHSVFKSSHGFFRCEYLLGRASTGPSQDISTIFSRVLRYPICTQEVLELILRQLPQTDFNIKSASFEIPRRLFRSLVPKEGTINWKEKEQPLPFLRYLFDSPRIPKPNVNSFDGYALTKAVHAKFIPLIQFLLKHGAEPQHKNCLAVLVAIRQRELPMVKLLIERDDSPYADVLGMGKRKRRKLEDRVIVNQSMLKAAVKCDARDIVDYLTWEKGCVPDMHTLHMMTA